MSVSDSNKPVSVGEGRRPDTNKPVSVGEGGRPDTIKPVGTGRATGPIPTGQWGRSPFPSGRWLDPSPSRPKAGSLPERVVGEGRRPDTNKPVRVGEGRRPDTIKPVGTGRAAGPIPTGPVSYTHLTLPTNREV